MKRDKVLSILKITKHQYYHQSKGTRPGKKPSQTTKRIVSGEIVTETNEQVVNQIVKLQSDPDSNYGYRKMYYALMILGYFINHKKVYRLMKQYRLLKPKYKKTSKNYAQFRIVSPREPLEVMEMDIKYVWITEARRHAYILTIIDTFTRFVLHWQLGFTMKAAQVKSAWESVIINHLQEYDQLKKGIHVEVRNDNGPQFGAKVIQNFFKENYLNQVFTHPYTPQENGHIESFHSILSRSIEQEVYWNLNQLEKRLESFYYKYNYKRIHASIANLSPALFWELWNQGKITAKPLKNRTLKFRLTIPYQQLPDIVSPEGVPCLNYVPLDAAYNLPKEVNGPVTLQQPPAQRSPSVVPC